MRSRTVLCYDHHSGDPKELLPPIKALFKELTEVEEGLSYAPDPDLNDKIRSMCAQRFEEAWKAPHTK